MRSALVAAAPPPAPASDRGARPVRSAARRLARMGSPGASARRLLQGRGDHQEFGDVLHGQHAHQSAVIDHRHSRQVPPSASAETFHRAGQRRLRKKLPSSWLQRPCGGAAVVEGGEEISAGEQASDLVIPKVTGKSCCVPDKGAGQPGSAAPPAPRDANRVTIACRTGTPLNVIVPGPLELPLRRPCRRRGR